VSMITATTPYEQHRDYVLNVLARRCRWLEPDERESMLHDAYMVFLQKERDGLLDVAAMRPEQVRAYLTQTAINKAMDDGNRARRKRSVALEDAGGLEVADQRPDTVERFVRGYDAERVREIVDELPERQQLVVKLRFFLDLSPTEVQQHLGITERAYRRDLERAMRALSDDVDLVRRGTSCDQRRSLILAYVAGIAGPNRVLAAKRHLATCSGCAAWAAELRTTAHQAGALVPLPLGGAAVHHEHWWQKAVDHATGWMLRADPGATSALGAARPGAVAALVAGCLTVGGTTYCAVDLGGHRPAPVQHHHVAQRATPPSHTTTTMRRPDPPAARTATTPRKRISSHARTRARSATASTSASRASTAKARKVETQAAQQFGVEGASSAPTVQQNATAAAAKAVRPAPGGGASAAAVAQEFGP
jgi:RNA polymerase sigma factor (sigma-70 family)